MKSYYRNILLVTAVLTAAAACTKHTGYEGQTPADMTIRLSATEAGTPTKALLDNGTFNATGNRIQIYDYYSGQTDPYINDQIESEGPDNNVWPFVGQKYSWTPDGTHKFFGWLHTDVNMDPDQTASAFFGAENFTFDKTTQTLSIPTINMLQTTPQFDFMYSNIYERDLTANPDYVTPVPLEFSHLFTAFNITAENRSTKNSVKINSVTVSGLKNNNSATINFAGTQTNVAYGAGSDSDASAAEFSFTPAGGVTLSTSTATISDNYLMWPQTFTEDSYVTFTINYDFTDGATNTTATYTKPVKMTSGTWEAGKKNNVNLVFKDKEIILQCVVQNWEVAEEEIDFSDQVTVSDTGYLTWDEDTVESCDIDTGDVILYTDESMVATCTFTIDTPKGATWTASLIPVEGHQDAFTIVDGTKYGAVGVESTIKIKVNNQAPIAPRHICILRITVQTSDGRTIVVKNLVPEGKGYEEFRIIQNLING